MGYQTDISINKHALDFELERQAQLVDSYGMEQAVAEYKRDRFKDRLELEKSDIFIDVKTNFEDYGFDKQPTDTLAKSTVERQASIQKLKQKLRGANFKVNAWKASNRALSHKKTSLQGLYQLFTTGYWGAVKVPGDQQNEYTSHDQDHYNASIQDDERMNERRREKNGEEKR